MCPMRIKASVHYDLSDFSNLSHRCGLEIMPHYLEKCASGTAKKDRLPLEFRLSKDDHFM